MLGLLPSLLNRRPNGPQCERLVDGLAEIDALRADVAGLTDIVHEVDRKVSLVIESQHTSGANPSRRDVKEVPVRK